MPALSRPPAHRRRAPQRPRRALDQAYYVLMPSNPQILAYRDNLQGISRENFNPMIAFRTGTLWKTLSKN